MLIKRDTRRAFMSNGVCCPPGFEFDAFLATFAFRLASTTTSFALPFLGWHVCRLQSKLHVSNLLVRVSHRDEGRLRPSPDQLVEQPHSRLSLHSRAC